MQVFSQGDYLPLPIKLFDNNKPCNPLFPITHYPLPITHYPFPIPHSPFPITHYPLPIPHSPFPITHYPLPITHYPLPITHYPLPIPHSPFPIPHSLLISSEISVTINTVGKIFIRAVPINQPTIQEGRKPGDECFFVPFEPDGNRLDTQTQNVRAVFSTSTFLKRSVSYGNSMGNLSKIGINS